MKKHLEFKIQCELEKTERAVTYGGLSAFGAIASYLIGLRLLPQTLLAALLTYLFTGSRPTSVYSIVRTIPRDFKAAVRFVRLQAVLRRYEKQGVSVAAVFERVVSSHPNKVAFRMDDQELTFRDANELSNRVAQYFHAHGFKHGDTVALFMETRIDYALYWLGLSKLGVVTALINTNLRKETLVHSITVAGCKAVIVGPELASALQDVLNTDGVRGLPIYQLQSGGTTSNLLPGATNLTEALETVSTARLSFDVRQISVRDKMVYIYTSGTTGLPKAAVITNLRYMFMALGSNYMLDIRPTDVIYNPLPLYHTAGGMVGVGSVFLRGLTMALRKRFSASQYWSDCIKYNATVAQYIGELCRFVLMSPPQSSDTQHNIRMIYGNGLKPQIWPQLVARFKIPLIGEVYGSTEGNSNLANFDNKVGAIGFIPSFAKKVYPVTLVRCNEQTGEPLRDKNGRCIKCGVGEAGVFVGKINPKIPSSNFLGYSDKKASDKKILRDVFREGDTYFNSGDILVMDIFSYFYFKDRTGDTFRWRGENVSTAEVEAVISNSAQLQNCVVYGVEIPNTEGKAGMAAIVDTDHKLDIEQLAIKIRGSLPPYARPIFIRLIETEIEMTGTFKLKKLDLQQEGFNVEKIGDPIYWLKPDGFYRRLTADKYDEIRRGVARL